MKRGAPFQTGPPKKSFKNANPIEIDSKAVRFLVPSRAAGLIIGKGGENIKRIKQQHPAKMHIPDASGGERVFVIEDADIPTVCAIVRDILEKLKEICNGEALERRARPNKRDQAPGPSSEPESLLDLRLLVHQSQAGSIIGKGGERIKELRNKHKMKLIKVFQVCAPRSSDRVVQLISTMDNIVACLEAMLESINASPPRGERFDYDANCWDESMVFDYGGWLSAEGQRIFQQTGQAPRPQPIGMGPGPMQGNPMMAAPGGYPMMGQQMFPGQMAAHGMMPPFGDAVPPRDREPSGRGGRTAGNMSRGGRGGGRGGNYGSPRAAPGGRLPMSHKQPADQMMMDGPGQQLLMGGGMQMMQPAMMQMAPAEMGMFRQQQQQGMNPQGANVQGHGMLMMNPYQNMPPQQQFFQPQSSLMGNMPPRM